MNLLISLYLLITHISEVSNIVNLRNEIAEAIGNIVPDTIQHVEYKLLDSTKA